MPPKPSPSAPWPGANRAAAISAPISPNATTRISSSIPWHTAPTATRASTTATSSSRAGRRRNGCTAQSELMEKQVTLEVFRYLPDQEDEPRFQTYQVPFREDWVVLDALNYIKDYLDGTLTYRWSCRMGVCGSCGMMVNGEPKLTCAAFLKHYYPRPIRVEPLTNFQIGRASCRERV